MTLPAGARARGPEPAGRGPGAKRLSLESKSSYISVFRSNGRKKPECPGGPAVGMIRGPAATAIGVGIVWLGRGRVQPYQNLQITTVVTVSFVFYNFMTLV